MRLEALGHVFTGRAGKDTGRKGTLYGWQQEVIYPGKINFFPQLEPPTAQLAPALS